MGRTRKPLPQCVICAEPASSRAAKTCGARVCRLRLTWRTNGAADVPCAVYRCYDSAGALLYVGRSIDPDKRWGEHRRAAPWAGQVVRRDVEWFDTIHDALVAEQQATAREKPSHNIKGTKSGSYLDADVDWRLVYEGFCKGG